MLPRSSNFREMKWEKIKLQKTDEWTALSKIRVIPMTDKVHSTEEGGTTYTRNTDYEISYKSGEVRRLSTGTIAEDQEVYIDYLYIESGDFYQLPESVAWDSATKDRYRN
jgi:hypothetical protein